MKFDPPLIQPNSHGPMVVVLPGSKPFQVPGQSILDILHAIQKINSGDRFIGFLSQILV